MSSDNPCQKPTFDPLPDDPLFEDCHIAPVPPPISDCPDIDVPTPSATDILVDGGGGSLVLPVVVVESTGNCFIQVQKVIVGAFGSFVPVGDPFMAYVLTQSCSCQNIWPGMRGYASKEDKTNSWSVAIDGVSPVISFRLSEDISAQQADAKIYVASGGSYVDSGRTTTVHDPLNSFPCAKSGASGYAVCRPSQDGSESTRWEIIRCQQRAPMIKFRLINRLNESDTEASVEVVEAYGTNYWKPDEGDAVTVKSTLKWKGQPTAEGLATLDADCNYIIIQIDCPVSSEGDE